MESDPIPPIKQAADLLTVPVIAAACEVSMQAVYKWLKNGRLPRTEWTGETDYASIIERLANGKIARTQLLQLPPRPAADASIPIGQVSV